MALLFRVLLPLILVGVVVATVVDIVRIDDARVRGLPKVGWIVLVIALPLLGVILWFTIGREEAGARNHGRYRDAPVAPSRPAPRGPLAPDDDPDFLLRLRKEHEQEERIRRLEQRLDELGDDGPRP